MKGIAKCTVLAALAILSLSQITNAVELRILDASKRQPLPGAVVEWTLAGGRQTTTSDAQGAATVPIGANQDFHVTARKPGFAPMTMSWPRGKAPVQFDLHLPAAQTVGGRIVTKSNAPVAGAHITINVPRRLAGPFVIDSALQATSDTNGVWRCEAVSASAAYLEVEISHPQFELSVNDASREKLIAGQAHCVMVPVFTLRGRILDHEGRFVSRANAVLTSQAAIFPGSMTRETIADTQGEFQFHRLHARRHLLGILANGFAPSLQAIEATNNFSPIEIRLNRGSPISLRIEDAAGNPLPDTSVRVDEWAPPLPRTRGQVAASWRYVGLEWTSDRDGRMTWSNAPAGEIALSIGKSGYMRKSHHRLNTSERDHAVTLGPVFSISGRVLDADTDRPIPEFSIGARFASISIFNGRTNVSLGTWYDHNEKQFKDGAYALTFDHPLLSGSRDVVDWQFRAQAEGYEPALSRVILDSERGTNVAFRLKREAIPQIDVDAPSDANRVTAALTAYPKPARYGDMITLYAKVRVAPGCYIYALEDSGCRNLPTSLTNRSLPFFKPEGPWRGPDPKVKGDGSRTLSGDILFRRRYTAVDNGVGPVHGEKLPIDLTFQVCNEALCWPPETIHLETRIDVLASQ
jgi:hypothetical protein